MAIRQEIRHAVEHAVRIRAFEQVLLEEFERGGIRGTVHTSLGQEMLPALLSGLMHDDDKVFGTHRSHGYYLALTNDYKGLAEEILGKSGGCSLGLGGSQHLIGAGIFTNGIQGGFVPVAGGYSLGAQRGVSIVVIGDGTLGQGILYETLNLAAKFSMRLLVLMEDNGIAQSTPSSDVFRGNLKKRVEGFAVSFFESDDSDLADLEETLGLAIAKVRDSSSPAFLRVGTQRLGPHSKGDDNRPTELLRKLWREEPLERLFVSGVVARDLLEQAMNEMRALFSLTRGRPSSTEYFKEEVWKSKVLGAQVSDVSKKVSEGPALRLQVREALSRALDESKELQIFGEDIESIPAGMERPYSGAFGVMGDLSRRYPRRVHNTPISEQAIVGMGIGRALSGRPTMVEIMFADFTTLIVDQIRQQATKITWMYGRHLPLPLVVRTATGGRRGYGPTHSQNLETMFIGVPNLNVYVMSPLGFPPDLFLFLFSTGYPSIVFEDKDLYSLPPTTSVHPAYSLVRSGGGPASFARLSPLNATPSLCIVSYGNAARIVLEDVIPVLASDYEMFADVMVLELISPLDVGPIADCAQASKKILVVEEGDGRSGLTSHIVSWRDGVSISDSFLIRSLSGSAEIGACEFSENQAKLSATSVIDACVSMAKHQRN